MTQYPGYTTRRTEPCPMLHGTATVLTHDFSGATVLLLENQDNNKAFGIGFGTFPSDNTGVFHILEHSVLEGSEKYPVTSPFLQLIKSSMASFLNAMTFSDKTVYPFASPNETDFKNLMDVYLNAVFCPLALTDRRVFDQEAWHREEDGSISGVVYNEMQGALASPEAQLEYALVQAMFPDNGYGFESGGDPAAIPGLTYEQFIKVYRRHYRADNCCIVLYGRMDFADKLDFLDKAYLAKMPKTGPRPHTALQHPQSGVTRVQPYYTDTPENIPVQSVLAWYTGDFADRERQLAVQILLNALLGSNQSPLKQALLEQKLGADLEYSFDDSLQQPVFELVLKGTDEARAAQFAGCVKAEVEKLCAEGVPQDLLLAALNAIEFALTEHPDSYPDGVTAAIAAVTGWLHADDPMADLRSVAFFDSLREKLAEGWFNQLLAELFAPAPVQVTLVPQHPAAEETAALRVEDKMQLDHPLTVADLTAPPAAPAPQVEQLAGLELVCRPSAGSLYLNFYYDLGGLCPEDMPYLQLLTDLLPELDTARHTARELTTLRDTWLGNTTLSLERWAGRQEGSPCHAKLALRLSLLERSAEKAVELGSELLYETLLGGENARAALQRVLEQTKLSMEQKFLWQGNTFAMMRAGSHFTVGQALSERCVGVSYYRFVCDLLEKADWENLLVRLDTLRVEVLGRHALTVCLHGSEDAARRVRGLLSGSAFAAEERQAAKAYTEDLTPPVNEAFIIQGGVNYDVLAWAMEPRAERKVLAQVMSYEYLWHAIREVGGAYGTGMICGTGTEVLYTYRDPHVKGSYENFAQGPAALAEREYTEADLTDAIIGTVAKFDSPRKPRQAALEADRRWFCGLTDEMDAADRAAICGVDAAWMKSEAAGLADAMAGGARCTFGSREAIERAKDLFDRIETLE